VSYRLVSGSLWIHTRSRTDVNSLPLTHEISRLKAVTNLVWIFIVTRLIDYRWVLDWWLDLLDTYTTRDYTSQITITHRPVFSVTLLGNGFNGGRYSDSGLTSLQAGDHTTSTAYPRRRLSRLVQTAFPYSPDTDRTENIASNGSSIVADSLPIDGSGIVACLHGRCLAMVVSLALLFCQTSCHNILLHNFCERNVSNHLTKVKANFWGLFVAMKITERIQFP
jgi:hypothetical protein